MDGTPVIRAKVVGTDHPLEGSTAATHDQGNHQRTVQHYWGRHPIEEDGWGQKAPKITKTNRVGGQQGVNSSGMDRVTVYYITMKTQEKRTSKQLKVRERSTCLGQAI